MSNTIGYAKIFQDLLDKVVTQKMTSNKLEIPAAQYRYKGGKTISIADIALSGLGDYSRSNGYASGNATLTWTDHTFKMDRARRFDLDAMDIDESNFVADASVLLGEFGRTKIAPELDAYRYSSIAKKAYNLGSGHYTAALTITSSNAFSKLSGDIAAVLDKGFEPEELTVYIPWTIYNLLINDEAIRKNLDIGVRSAGDGVETRFYRLNGVELVPVMSDRMKSGYDFYDGTSDGKTAGGFVKKATALSINWLIVPAGSAVAIVKHKVDKIIAPEANQTYDGYSIYSRIYHDCFFSKNRSAGIYASFADAIPSTKPEEAFNA